ncbi:arylformamidase [Ureibacillus manganicus]|uniref:Kynurenine formamidase n=1 Tax=Ureibacillus manganicus DSM 26584 TaxID=1384049 RepID=A0A0A3I4C0_9BACL|nr:arylformamidase [Ureibacillus manganicus]KGR79584.1 kynurenine formamidase [Ureibacillus manganicus DSM 26584]
MAKKWIDITQPFTNTIATWPGDTPFTFDLAYTKYETGSVNIGRFTTSTHTGTHADAPFHFDDNTPTVDQLDINVFIGTALVVDLSNKMELCSEDFKDIDLRGAKRILLKLHQEVNFEEFPELVPIIHPDIAPFLKEKGVVLLGVDCPSVDALDSKSLNTHHSLYNNGIYIIENLVLQNITPGFYEFIGLPLNIVGADAAPVRAVISKIDD